MKSFGNWLSNVLEGMADAFVHPIKNELPPEIGTLSYSDRPERKRKSILYN